MNRSFSFSLTAGVVLRRGVLLAVPAWFFLATAPGQAAPKGEWVSQGRGAVWKPAAETSPSASGSKGQRVSKSKSKGKGKTGSGKKPDRSSGSRNASGSNQEMRSGSITVTSGTTVLLPGGSGVGNTFNGGGTDVIVGGGLGSGGLISGGGLTLGGGTGSTTLGGGGVVATTGGGLTPDNSVGILTLNTSRTWVSPVLTTGGSVGGGLTTGNYYPSGLIIGGSTWLTTSGPINVSSITFGSGSQLQLTAANQINDSAAIHMNGGTLHTGGLNQRVGILTLSGNNVVDLGTGASVLRFADSSSATWGGTLNVRNWTGNPAGGGIDQLFFGNTAGGLTSSQLANVSFVDPAGFSVGIYGSTLLESGELVPQTGSGELVVQTGSGILPLSIVSNGGSLGGISGIVTSSGNIAPGNSPGTLANLELVGFDNTSVLNFELSGTDQTVGGGVNDLFTGITNLTLNGTLNVSEFTSGSFLSADLGDSWRLYEYSGTLTDRGLSLGDLPSLPAGLSFAVDTAVPGQVNLVVVPEPGAAGLLALAGGVLAGGRRRRSGKPD